VTISSMMFIPSCVVFSSKFGSWFSSY